MRPTVDPRPLPAAVKRLVKVPRVLTARLRCTPDFIIIGAQRSGSTSLYRHLVEHPSVLPAFRKEVHFFDINFRKGLDWYREHFPLRLYRTLLERVRKGPMVTGEASVYYMFHPHAARRASVAVPEAKLIALLRNPVDRAYSHYHLERRLGREQRPFEEAIAAETTCLRSERERMLTDEDYYSEPYRRQSYLSRGVYIDQLRAWMSLFPRERVLILRSEDFYADPGGILTQTLAFLGLGPPTVHEYRTHNRGVYPPMDPPTRERLREYFRPHNRRLAEFLDRDFEWEGRREPMATCETFKRVD